MAKTCLVKVDRSFYPGSDEIILDGTKIEDVEGVDISVHGKQWNITLKVYIREAVTFEVT